MVLLRSPFASKLVHGVERTEEVGLSVLYLEVAAFLLLAELALRNVAILLLPLLDLTNGILVNSEADVCTS